MTVLKPKTQAGKSETNNVSALNITTKTLPNGSIVNHAWTDDGSYVRTDMDGHELNEDEQFMLSQVLKKLLG